MNGDVRPSVTGVPRPAPSGVENVHARAVDGLVPRSTSSAIYGRSPMYPVRSFCGERPVVAWFEGPAFREVVDSADKVRAEGAWCACSTCVALVEANDRESLVERAFGRMRRKDADMGAE